jgi:hypothetical protein
LLFLSQCSRLCRWLIGPRYRKRSRSDVHIP